MASLEMKPLDIDYVFLVYLIIHWDYRETQIILVFIWFETRAGSRGSHVSARERRVMTRRPKVPKHVMAGGRGIMKNT